MQTRILNLPEASIQHMEKLFWGAQQHWHQAATPYFSQEGVRAQTGQQSWKHIK